MLDAYQRFWCDNPESVALTHARAASYWDAYYRGWCCHRTGPVTLLTLHHGDTMVVWL